MSDVFECDPPLHASIAHHRHDITVVLLYSLGSEGYELNQLHFVFPNRGAFKSSFTERYEGGVQEKNNKRTYSYLIGAFSPGSGFSASLIHLAITADGEEVGN